jgi:glycosyltransferase involved in cell wall biosynthesis
VGNVFSFEISIVMPCLNEAQTLAKCILKAQKAIHQSGLSAEIIVADNGSTDGSQEIAAQHGVRVVHATEKGYGAALMAGISAAKGAFIIMGDADDSYDFTQIYPFIQKLREGYDLVNGCRLPKGGGKIMPDAMPWKHRWIGNPVLSAIGKLFFHSPLSDFHCGLRGFRRASFEKMELRTTGMEFASEMIIKTTLKDMRVAEVPITLYKDGRSRPPHLRSWRDGWRHLRFMLLFSPKWLFLIPGCIFFLLGTIFSAILLRGALKIGAITFDTNTLLVSSMAILVGFQLMTFSAFAKIFAITQGLLPEDPHFLKIFNFITLEKGIYVGFLCIISGFTILTWATIYWKHHNYGPLSYPYSLRLVIPGVTAFILGIGIVFSSFFMSILGLRQK